MVLLPADNTDVQLDDQPNQPVLLSPLEEEDQDSIPPALSKDRSLSVSVNRVRYLTQDDGEILDIQPVCRNVNQDLSAVRGGEQRVNPVKIVYMRGTRQEFLILSKKK